MKPVAEAIGVANHARIAGGATSALASNLKERWRPTDCATDNPAITASGFMRLAFAWPRSSTGSSDQRDPQAITQRSFADGFAQECDSTGRQHLCARRLVRETCNNNRRDGETVGEQTTVKLNPGQTRHVQIRNQARSVSYAIRIEKIFS